MKLSLAAWGASTPETYSELRSDMKFRKATSLMVECIAAINALRKMEDIKSNEAAVVLSSVVGELNCSTEFLKAWTSDGVSRPLLFQNSLFHSTLGFLSIYYKFRGPTLTLGNNNQTLRSSLMLAHDLLETGQCSECLLLGAEEFVEGYEVAYKNVSRKDRSLKSGGAGALLLRPHSDSARLSIEVNSETSLPRETEQTVADHEIFTLASFIQDEKMDLAKSFSSELGLLLRSHLKSKI